MTDPPDQSWSVPTIGLPPFGSTPGLVEALEHLGHNVEVAPGQRSVRRHPHERLCVISEGLFIARHEQAPDLRVAELLFPGDVVIDAVSGEGHRGWSIAAVWPGRTMSLSETAVDHLIESRTDAARWLLTAMTVRVRRAHSRQLNLMSCDARARLAAFLIEWCHLTGSDQLLSNPRQGGLLRSHLADLLGVNRATIRQSLQAFEQRGLITQSAAGVVVLDELQLARRATGAEPCLHGVRAIVPEPSGNPLSTHSRAQPYRQLTA